MSFLDPFLDSVQQQVQGAATQQPAEVEPSQLEELGRQMTTGLDHVEEAFNNVFGLLSEAADVLPGAIWEKVRPFVDPLKSQGELFLSLCGDAILAIGFPGAAVVLSLYWVDDVRNPVRGVLGEVQQAQRFVRDNWKGRAQAAYDGAVAAQENALREVTAIIEDMRNLLLAAAAAITAFYVALGAAIAEAAAALEVGGSAAAIVRALPKILGQIVAKVQEVTKLVAAAGAVVGAQAASLFDLNDRIATNENFPGGRWPESNASAMSDASMQDGDASDWRLNYG